MLEKNLRLRSGSDFERVYKTGRRVTEKHLQLFYLHIPPAPISRQNLSRFGFVVSKKAVPTIQQRNRIKRRLRGLVQLRLGDFDKGCDYIFQARRNIADLTKAEITHEFDRLLHKLETK